MSSKMSSEASVPAEERARIDAGSFRTWLNGARAVLRGGGAATVPCGDCVGCCTSSYFVHVRPEDTGARAVIPARLLVKAPGQPDGHFVVGFSNDGSCPMLNERSCSIYPQRPRTCRDYDCRIFAAAGIDAGGPDKAVINERVRAWTFIYDDDADRLAHLAVRTAAAFIGEHAASFPDRRGPSAPSDIAVLALKAYAVFLELDASNKSEEEIAAAIVDACRRFDADAGVVPA
jgi:hypothetical protein